MMRRSPVLDIVRAHLGARPDRADHPTAYLDIAVVERARTAVDVDLERAANVSPVEVRGPVLDQAVRPFDMSALMHRERVQNPAPFRLHDRRRVPLGAHEVTELAEREKR